MSRMGVVTIAHGRHDHLRAQHASLARWPRRPDVYVIVAMGDPGLRHWPAYDGLPAQVVDVDVPREGLPLAAARNRGLDTAGRAGCDVLVGLDVDCLAGPTLLSAYESAVREEPALAWAGPVTALDPAPRDDGLDGLEALDDADTVRPTPARGCRVRGGDPDLFWSRSFALDSTTWLESGGFCEDYVGHGAEDTDFGRQLALRGIPLAWDGSARAYHQRHPARRAPRERLDDILRSGRTFRARWGTWPMRGWLQEFERLGMVVRDGDDWVRTGRGPPDP